MSKLYYNTDLLDYNGTPTVRHNAFDIRDADIGSTSKSYDLEIQLTPINRKLLSVPDQINGRVELTGIFRLYVESALLIQGKLRIFKTTRISITGIIEATEWTSGLTSKSIRSLGWVAGDKHLFSSAYIRGSWLDTASTLFRYPLIYFGKLWSEMTGTSAQVMPWDFVPMWNVYEIVKKMFKEINYSLSGTPDEGTAALEITQTQSESGEPNYYHFGFIDRNPKTGKYIHLVRLGNDHIGNEGKMVLFWSDDGKTGWALVSTIVNSAQDDRGTGGGYDSTGRLFMFWNNYSDPGGSNYNAVIYSDDNGLTWTAENQILVFGAGETGTIFGRIIELDNGTLIQSGYWLLAGVYSLGYFKSIDSGVNWTRHDIITTGATYTYSEGSFLYLGGNRILIVCRKSLSGANTTYHQFYSNDNGATWTDQGDTTFETWGVTSGRERPPFIELLDYLGKKIVACYYVVTDSQKFKVVYGLASDALSQGVSMWKGLGAELMGAWTNVGGWETWTVSGKDITSAIESSSSYSASYNPISVVSGKAYYIVIIMTKNSGTMPTVKIFNAAGTVVRQTLTVAAGVNIFTYNCVNTETARLYVENLITNNTNFSCKFRFKDSTDSTITDMFSVDEYSPPSGYTRNGYQTVKHLTDKWQGVGQLYHEPAAITDRSDILYYTTPLDNRVRVLTSLGLTDLIDNAKNFFATRIGRNLYIMGSEPVSEIGFSSGKTFEANVNAITDNRVTYTYATTETYTLQFPMTVLIFLTPATSSDYYTNNTGVYLIPETGSYRFYTKIKIFSTSNDITDAWSGVAESYTLQIYNQTTATVLYEITGSGANDFFKTAIDLIVDTGYVKCTAGDEIVVRLQAAAQATNDDVGSRVAEIYVKIGTLSTSKNYHDKRSIYKGFNFEVSPVTFLPDITCIDLLKAVKHLFGLRFWVDQLRRKVHVFPTDQFITGNIIDWSNIIDFSKNPEHEFIAGNYKESQILKYKNDTSDRALQDYISASGFPYQKVITLTSENVQEGEETRENPIFAPTIERYWFDMTGYVPTMWDNFDFPDAIPDNRLTKFEPRLFLWEGLQPKAWVYNANFLTTPESLTQYPKAKTLDIADLYASYYQKFWHYIDKSKLITVNILTDINRLTQFTTVLNNGEEESFRATYKLTIEGSPMYFILNSLVTDGKIAKCEFIQKI